MGRRVKQIKLNKTGKTNKTNKTDKTNKTNKTNKTGKTGKTNKTDKTNKTNKTGKTDCFAYKPTKCVALTNKKCDGCNFYKTKEEFEVGREKVMERIHSLDVEKQDLIIRTYYGGGKDGWL
ncbi:hypothetical protein EDC18_10577 [Natranaerovirga pectinivora]|uniref:Uncharacterized protein n=1 Tax=Natranaerovirga pectinivora TaxID=682400 RepID=A0A4R3MKW5_9FIRM|nr:hypothetical protein [Natranaerovirga pectinivora]TCT14596.1 hypothetical protein EDC18_10577 [Natranaerovirga pectinivora]